MVLRLQLSKYNLSCLFFVRICFNDVAGSSELANEDKVVYTHRIHSIAIGLGDHQINFGLSLGFCEIYPKNTFNSIQDIYDVVCFETTNINIYYIQTVSQVTECFERICSNLCHTLIMLCVWVPADSFPIFGCEELFPITLEMGYWICGRHFNGPIILVRYQERPHYLLFALFLYILIIESVAVKQHDGFVVEFVHLKLTILI